MAVLTTKFGVGDKVFCANVTIEKRQHDCPDCLGSKKWACTSPTGATFEVACPRCGGGYQSNRELSLDYSWYVPSVSELTVGLVRASSEAGEEYGQGNEYMCRETGIGSGTLYRESSLFATREEAVAASQIKADLQNADAEHWVAKQFNASIKFADYELKDAVMEAAASQSRRALYDVQYLLESLDEAETLEEAKERIADWREKKAEAA